MEGKYMEKTNEYKFCKFEEEHKTEVVSLINSVFGLSRDLQWWEWYYKRRENLEPIQIIVKADNKIVSQVHLYL